MLPLWVEILEVAGFSLIVGGLVVWIYVRHGTPPQAK